jgi:hypothetical protein
VTDRRQNSASSNTSAQTNHAKNERREFQEKLKLRIAADKRMAKFVKQLKARGFSEDRLVKNLIESALDHPGQQMVRDRTIQHFAHRERVSSGKLLERVRSIADEIENAEKKTPPSDLGNLIGDLVRTAKVRRRAIVEIQKLPKVLRLYADYLEKSCMLWNGLSRQMKAMNPEIIRVFRDRTQESIFVATGKYSDERYVPLLNAAYDVVGKPQIQIHPKTLIMRRARKRQRLPIPS